MVWLTSFWKTGPSQVVKNIKQCKCKMCPFSWNSSVHIAWRIHEQTGLLSICAMFSDIMSNFFVVQWLSSQSPWDREPCPAGSTVSVQPYSSNCESYSWPAVRPRIFYSLISILLFFLDATPPLIMTLCWICSSDVSNLYGAGNKTQPYTSALHVKAL